MEVLSEIARVDAKGRITIPSKAREYLGLTEGSYVVLTLYPERKEIVVSPLSVAGSEVVEFKISIEDRPGSLAEVARILGNLNIDLALTHSRTVRKGELAEWVAVADISQCEKSLEEIKKALLKSAVVKDVQIRMLT
ncbi:MAG: ACT domain-containing protein [Candidatus Verstraetearchaeota archaeon]|nr:ACT domain-containing protein [Candidatus Verstraetearchaeota archaeon]